MYAYVFAITMEASSKHPTGIEVVGQDVRRAMFDAVKVTVSPTIETLLISSDKQLPDASVQKIIDSTKEACAKRGVKAASVDLIHAQEVEA